MTITPTLRLFATPLLAMLLVVAVGCGSPPGVPAATSDDAAPPRLVPPGPGGALGEIQLAETTAAMPVKLAAARGFSESVGEDGNKRMTVDLSDFPANTTRLSLTLMEIGGRYYIERVSLMITGEGGREEWSLDPAFSGKASVHIDTRGRWHVKFDSVAITSESWPQATTLTGVVVAYR